MMFVGFLGCYGAIQESQCLLGTVRRARLWVPLGRVVSLPCPCPAACGRASRARDPCTERGWEDMGPGWPLRGARQRCLAKGISAPRAGALAELAGTPQAPACAWLQDGSWSQRCEQQGSWRVIFSVICEPPPPMLFSPPWSDCLTKHPLNSLPWCPLRLHLSLHLKAACGDFSSFKEPSTIFICLDTETAKISYSILVRTSRCILENPLPKCYGRPWCEAAAWDSWHRMSLIV